MKSNEFLGFKVKSIYAPCVAGASMLIVAIDRLANISATLCNCLRCDGSAERE